MSLLAPNNLCHAVEYMCIVSALYEVYFTLFLLLLLFKQNV